MEVLARQESGLSSAGQAGDQPSATNSKQVKRQQSLLSLHQVQREHLRNNRCRSGCRDVATYDSTTSSSSMPSAMAELRLSEVADKERRKKRASTSYALLSVDDDDDDKDSTASVPAVEDPTWLVQYGKPLLDSYAFQGAVALLIILNALVIGLETDAPGTGWDTIEQVLLLLFAMELTLRLFVIGATRFFDYSSTDFVWNMFDLVIVGLGVVDCLCEVVFKHVHLTPGAAPILLRMVRLLRILRIFRLIRFLKRLYILAYGFSLAGVAVFWVACLMTGLLYFCAIILVRTVGRLPESDADHDFFAARFATIGQAMFSLFQLAVQPNLIEYQAQTSERPFLMFFLVIFVIFGSFGMIALLTGVISEAMFEKNIMRLDDERKDRENVRKKMVKQCTDFFDEMRNANDECTVHDLQKLIPKLSAMFEEFNVPCTKHDLQTMIQLMDTDGSGDISRGEFCRGILQIAEEVRPMLVMELHYETLAYVGGRVDACMAALVQEHEEIKQLRAFVKESFSENKQKMHSEGKSPVYPSGASMDSLYTSLGSSGRDGKDPGERTKKQFQELLVPITMELRDLSGAIFSLGGRMEELVGDSLSVKVTSQLEELTLRRRMDAKAAGGGSQSSQAVPEPQLISEFTGTDKTLAAVLRQVSEDLRSLQGGLFSLSTRMEEVVTDSIAEKYSSRMQELAVLRQKAENDSAVATRLGQCEFAVLQASGAIRQLEDQTRNLAQRLHTSVHTIVDKKNTDASVASTHSATPTTLSRSHSLTTSEGRSRTDSTLGLGPQRVLSRSGSRENNLPRGPNGGLGNFGMLPALAESSTLTSESLSALAGT